MGHEQKSAKTFDSYLQCQTNLRNDLREVWRNSSADSHLWLHPGGRKATFVRACAKLANIFGDVRGQFCKVVWDLRSAMVTQWFGKIQMLCFHRVLQRTVNSKKAQKQRCDTAIPTKKANIFSAMMAYPT